MTREVISKHFLRRTARSRQHREQVAHARASAEFALSGYATYHVEKAVRGPYRYLVTRETR